MKHIINLDMDGTIANLYAVENWLPKLRAYDPSPYLDAKPLVRLSLLARYIHIVQGMGWQVNIVSWLSKDPNSDYGAAVTLAKIKWLTTHLPSVRFDNIFIVPHGVPKHTLSSGILFDDEIENRTAWNGADENNHAYDETVIFEVFRMIVAGVL